MSGFMGQSQLRAMLDRVTPLGELVTDFQFDDDSGLMHVRHTQDVEPILEHNKSLQEDPGFDGYNKARDWRHVADIPNVVIAQWLREGINVFDPNDTKAVLRKLDDPAYRHLRTSLGRLS